MFTFGNGKSLPAPKEKENEVTTTQSNATQEIARQAEAGSSGTTNATEKQNLPEGSSSQSPEQVAGSNSTDVAKVGFSIPIEFLNKLEKLEEILDQEIPQRRNILLYIHQKLSAMPEVVTILTVEQVNSIITGTLAEARVDALNLGKKKEKATKNVSKQEIAKSQNILGAFDASAL